MPESSPELQLELEKLERRHAENPEGRYFVPLANTHRKLGDVPRAESLLREGLRRHPDYLSAHIVLGRCLADRHATLEAAAEFRYVLSLDPQNLIALRTLGELAASDGRPDEAERWFRELLAIDPMNEEARVALEALEPPASQIAEPEEFEEGASWWERPVQVEEPAAVAEPAARFAEEWAALDAPAPAAEAAPEPEPVERTVEAPAPESEAPAAELPVAPRPAPDVEAAPDFDEPEPTPADEPDVLDSAELVTETIAELFARQGLHARAADVYRELLRRRGPDPALQRRLAEIEAEIGAGAPAAPADEQAPETEPHPEPEVLAPLDWGGFEDAFAASFADGFDLATPGPPPPAAPAAEPIATTRYFEELSLPEPPPPPPAPLEAPAPAAPSIAAMLAELAAWTPRQGDPMDEFPLPAPPAAAEPVPPPPPPPPPAPEAAAGGTIPASDVVFPWERPAPEPAPVTSESREPQREPESAMVPDAEPEPEPELEPEPAAVPDAEADDLESFQAWLRSLRR